MNFDKYIGIPWVCGEASLKAADCWGIVCLVYADLFNIKLGHFAINAINSEAKTAGVIDHQKGESRWKRQDKPIMGDVAVMYNKRNGRPEHVGIYIGSNMILHSANKAGGESSVHRVSVISRAFKKMEYYQYVG